MSSNQMTPRERQAAISLSAVFAFRMLGLFLILPVFALYAEHLPGSTPILVGLAIGIYGLTQAALQIPFGLVSDRIGRKPVILFGLLLFALGSGVAAQAETIEMIIFGRALQGAGAIAAAIMALAADLTREEHRPKAMAMIGMTIGMSFLVAMVAGPLFSSWFGVPGIFWLTALLAIIGMGVIIWGVPQPQVTRVHRDAETVPGQIGAALRNLSLLRLDVGIFVLHMVLTAGFVVLPLSLRDAGLMGADHWQVYLPVMVLAMAGAIPFIVVAETRKLIKQIVIGGALLMALSQFGFIVWHDSIWGIGLLMWVFFAGFNLMEAVMPSLIAKIAPVESKGTAMGVYTSAQFLGAFVGGVAGGALYTSMGVTGVFGFSAVSLLVWLVVVLGLPEPRYLATRMIYVGQINAEDAMALEQRIQTVPGVAEAVLNVDDGVVYLRVDNKALDEGQLDQFSAPEAAE